MDIETMKQLIKKYEPGHAAFVTRADIAERYYRNETDILFRDLSLIQISEPTRHIRI